MKKKIEEMKSEIRNLRIEEKAIKLRCYQAEAKLLEKERKIREGGSIKRVRRSKKKRISKKEQNNSEDSENDGQNNIDSNNEENDGEDYGDEENENEFIVKQHHLQILNTPVKRNELPNRPASAGAYRRPPSSSSRSNLHSSSSSSLFGEMIKHSFEPLSSSASVSSSISMLSNNNSNSSLVDVLDLVLSPSPRYSGDGTSYISPGIGSSRSSRREAFNVNNNTLPNNNLPINNNNNIHTYVSPNNMIPNNNLYFKDNVSVISSPDVFPYQSDELSTDNYSHQDSNNYYTQNKSTNSYNNNNNYISIVNNNSQYYKPNYHSNTNETIDDNSTYISNMTERYHIFSIITVVIFYYYYTN